MVMIDRKRDENLIHEQEPRRGEMPPYEAPRVVTYREEQILDELGPAQAGGYSGSGF
jgi:hypothetical protein